MISGITCGKWMIKVESSHRVLTNFLSTAEGGLKMIISFRPNLKFKENDNGNGKGDESK